MRLLALSDNNPYAKVKECIIGMAEGSKVS